MTNRLTSYFRRFTLSITFALLLFSGLGGALSTHAQTRAYVTNISDNTVSVIDTTTNTVIDTVPVGSNPIGIAITPPATPKTKDDCKDGGYKRFGPPVGPFKNQGQCIKFVNSPRD